MDGTIIGRGSFSASYSGTNPNPGVASNQAGNQQIIVIPSNADRIVVENYTKFGAAGTSAAYFGGTGNAYIGVRFVWNRGMANGSAMVEYFANGTSVMNGDTITSGGFTLYDPSFQSSGSQSLFGNPVATSASTNATRPVVSTNNTAGLSVGSVVRLSNTAQTDVNGIDFVVGAVVANTSFTLLTSTNALATAPGAIGGAGFYRIVNADSLFYPRRRVIVNITQAANANVSTSIAHGLTVGQAVRFSIPSVSGMIQLNSDASNNYRVATVVSVVDSYNFTIDIDTTSYTAFTFPTIAQEPVSPPEVVPVGENTSVSLSSNAAQLPLDWLGNPIYNANSGILADSTVNTGFLGMILGNGGNGTVLTTPIIGPAGSVHFSSADAITATDTMYWTAFKASYGGL